jgi:hypothetical protein
MDQQLREYRSFLISAEQKAQEQYDKTILTLSGGAFGISFAFIDKVIGTPPTATLWLLAAWTSWGVSITSILFSFYFSNKALRRTIEQVDEETVYENTPGEHFSGITQVLNACGGIFFFLGVVLLIVFVYKNI